SAKSPFVVRLLEYRQGWLEQPLRSRVIILGDGDSSQGLERKAEAPSLTDLPVHRQALLTAVNRLRGVTLILCQEGRPDQRPRPEPQRRVRAFAERARQRLATLGEVPAHVPEPPHRSDESQASVHVATLQVAIEGGAQVVVLHFEQVGPSTLLGSPQGRLRLFG